MKGLLTALVVLSATSGALAQDGDGVYRRWDRDLAIDLAAGGGVAVRDSAARPATDIALRLRIADAAGLSLAYRFAPDLGGHLFAAVELRPLWPALFLLNRSTGRRFVDLLLQSLSLELGVVWTPLGGAPDGAGRGTGLGAGLALELPLMVPAKGRVRRLSLRLGARRVWAPPRFRGGPKTDLEEWSALGSLVLTLGAGSGLSSWEPAR